MIYIQCCVNEMEQALYRFYMSHFNMSVTWISNIPWNWKKYCFFPILKIRAKPNLNIVFKDLFYFNCSLVYYLQTKTLQMHKNCYQKITVSMSIFCCYVAFQFCLIHRAAGTCLSTSWGVRPKEGGKGHEF